MVKGACGAIGQRLVYEANGSITMRIGHVHLKVADWHALAWLARADRAAMNDSEV